MMWSPEVMSDMRTAEIAPIPEAVTRAPTGGGSCWALSPSAPLVAAVLVDGALFLQLLLLSAYPHSSARSVRSRAKVVGLPRRE